MTSPALATPSEFLDFVLTTMYCRMHDRLSDNFDDSYPPLGVQKELQFNVDVHKNYMRFFIDNYERLFHAWTCLDDEYSKQLFVGLILFRLLGHLHARIPIDGERFWKLRADSRSLPAAPSPFAVAFTQTPIERFSVPLPATVIEVDCWRANVFYSFYIRQYHLDRDGLRIGPEPGDHVVDAGACFGDTALAFAHAVGAGGRVYAFDPMEDHVFMIRHNIGLNPAIGNIAVFPTGLADTDCDADASRLPRGVDVGFSVRRHGAGVPLRRLDRLVEEAAVERVDFLKMDIEGAELSALRGAEASIRRFRPKLAISLYHNPEDYFTIPEFIRDLDLGYRMHLENYTISSGETVLYAAAR